jgi:hypothetical protein
LVPELVLRPILNFTLGHMTSDLGIPGTPYLTLDP